MYYLHFEHIYKQQKANKLIPNFTILQIMLAFYLGKMEDFKPYQNYWGEGGEITVTGIRSAINTVISCMYFTILCYAMACYIVCQ